jgi:hypothetical protein
MTSHWVWIYYDYIESIRNNHFVKLSPEIANEGCTTYYNYFTMKKHLYPSYRATPVSFFTNKYMDFLDKIYSLEINFQKDFNMKSFTVTIH